MTKSPAFLFYTNDFISGTQFFTDEQIGIYIRLLCAQHQHGHLTEKQVLFISKSYDNEIMEKYVKDSEGKYYNIRLEEEIIKRDAFSKSRSNNKKGKTKEEKPIDLPLKTKSYDNHMENENESENTFLNKDYDKNLYEEIYQRLIMTSAARQARCMSNSIDEKKHDELSLKFKLYLVSVSWKDTTHEGIRYFGNWLPKELIRSNQTNKANEQVKAKKPKAPDTSY